MIGDLAIFINGFLADPFQLEASLFQCCPGANIIDKGAGKNSENIKIGKAIFTGLDNRFGHDSFAPEGFAQPVSHLGTFTTDIILKHQSNRTNGLIINVNGERIS